MPIYSHVKIILYTFDLCVVEGLMFQSLVYLAQAGKGCSLTLWDATTN